MSLSGFCPPSFRLCGGWFRILLGLHNSWSACITDQIPFDRGWEFWGYDDNVIIHFRPPGWTALRVRSTFQFNKTLVNFVVLQCSTGVKYNCWFGPTMSWFGLKLTLFWSNKQLHLGRNWKLESISVSENDEKCHQFGGIYGTKWKKKFHIIIKLNIQFIYSNRYVYIAIALCSKLLHSAIAI
jgi:hypothetical protein